MQGCDEARRQGEGCCRSLRISSHAGLAGVPIAMPRAPCPCPFPCPCPIAAVCFSTALTLTLTRTVANPAQYPGPDPCLDPCPSPSPGPNAGPAQPWSQSRPVSLHSCPSPQHACMHAAPEQSRTVPQHVRLLGHPVRLRLQEYEPARIRTCKNMNLQE